MELLSIRNATTPSHAAVAHDPDGGVRRRGWHSPPLGIRRAPTAPVHRVSRVLYGRAHFSAMVVDELLRSHAVRELVAIGLEAEALERGRALRRRAGRAAA